MIGVSPSLLGLSSYTAAWIICTCIVRFTFKPLINIDFSVTLRCIPDSYSKLPSFLTISILIIVANMKHASRYRQVSRECNIDFSRRLLPNYHKKWLLTKKNGKTVSGFFKICVFFFKNLFYGKRQSFPLVTREIR